MTLLTVESNELSGLVGVLLLLLEGEGEVVEQLLDTGCGEALCVSNGHASRLTVKAMCRAAGSPRAFKCHPCLLIRSPMA